MPTSNLAVAPYVINLVEQSLPHTHVLDVGPGWGKYAVLLREYLNVKPRQIDAVEAWTPYVEEHRLLDLYDRVWYGAAGDATWRLDPPQLYEHRDGAGRLIGVVPGYEPDAHVYADDAMSTVDMVLMVDVIEHMQPDAVSAFLGWCPRARVVVCTPVDFFDNGPGLPPTEEHVSHWTPAALADLGRPVEVMGERDGALLARLGPA